MLSYGACLLTLLGVYEFGNMVCQRGAYSRWGPPPVRHLNCRTRELRNTVGCAFLNVTPGRLTPATAPYLEQLLAARRFGEVVRPNELVLHLRLGDLAHAVDASHIAASIDKADRVRNRTFVSVTLVGSVVAGSKGTDARHANTSRQALAQVVSRLRRTGRLVHLRITQTSSAVAVDRDVAFMRTARHFLCTHGTFSRAVAMLVNYTKGVVYNPGQCLAACSKVHPN